MKPKLLICLLLLAGWLPLRAQTNDLQTRLQQGLLAEEATHDLPTAITTYQALAAKFAEDREVAATAVYRLGECYRKLGQTNNAAAQYERILHEFADVKMLPDLCRQNLAGMGLAVREQSATATNANPAADAAAQAALRAATLEMNTYKAQLEELQQAKPSQMRNLVQQNYPNPVFTKLLQDLTTAEQNLESLAQQFGSEHPDRVRAATLVKTINHQLDDQVDATLEGLRSKYALAQQRVKELQAQPPALTTTPDTVPVPNEEDQEIARLQQMLQNSPDLINRIVSGGRTPLGNAAATGQLKVAAYLLDHGADVNAVAMSFNQATPLYLAAEAGNRAMVELLLKRGAAINAQLETGVISSSNPVGTEIAGQTALYVAVNRGYQAVMDVLLANHADVNLADNSGATPLQVAAKNNNLKILQSLLAAGALVNLTNRADQSALNLAVDANAPEIVAALLASHAEVNVTNKYSGGTPLHQAAIHANTAIVQKLLAAGAQVNLEDSNGRTPLSYASDNGSIETVKLLLAAHADPGSGKIDLPIFSAIHSANATIVELLLQAGANPNAGGKMEWQDANQYELKTQNWPPLWWAIHQNQLSLVQLLLTFKADPNATTPYSVPIVFEALPHPDILSALLDAGANVDLRNPRRDNMTPLAQAADSHLLPAVKILLAHGADANARSASGQTILHFANIFYSDNLPKPEIISTLLEHHADPNVRENFGKTPLDLAKTYQNNGAETGKVATEIVALLRQHGALDDLPDWDSITLSRPAANFSTPIFKRSTNDWNHFTLLEFLRKVYSFPPGPPRGETPAFPDLAHVVIVRPEATGTNRQRILVNLLNATNGLDVTQNRPLEFGDRVEIPEREHLLNALPMYLETAQMDALDDYLKQHSGMIQLTAAGGTAVSVPLPPLDATLNEVLRDKAAQTVLTSQCDLDHVKVIRTDATTGKKQEWILKYPEPADTPNAEIPIPALPLPGQSLGLPRLPASTKLWLRNGDRIEIPLKP